jgi:hypothetical protein
VTTTTTTGTLPTPRRRGRLYRDGRCVARDFAMVDTEFGLHELAVQDALHEAP